MAEKSTAFRDLPADAYPFTVEYLNAKGVVVRTEYVEGPGMMEVPPLHNLFGPISVRITFANGDTHTEGPPTSGG